MTEVCREEPVIPSSFHHREREYFTLGSAGSFLAGIFWSMVPLVKLLAVLASVRFSVASTWKSKRISSPMFFDPSKMQI